MTKSLFAGLKNCRDIFRLLVRNELPQHVGEDIDSLRNLPPGICQRRRPIGHGGIESAKDMRHRVDEKDSFSRHSRGSGTLWWHYELIIGWRFRGVNLDSWLAGLIFFAPCVFPPRLSVRLVAV